MTSREKDFYPALEADIDSVMDVCGFEKRSKNVWTRSCDWKEDFIELIKKFETNTFSIHICLQIPPPSDDDVADFVPMLEADLRQFCTDDNERYRIPMFGKSKLIDTIVRNLGAIAQWAEKMNDPCRAQEEVDKNPYRNRNSPNYLYIKKYLESKGMSCGNEK